MNKIINLIRKVSKSKVNEDLQAQKHENAFDSFVDKKEEKISLKINEFSKNKKFKLFSVNEAEQMMAVVSTDEEIFIYYCGIRFLVYKLLEKDVHIIDVFFNISTVFAVTNTNVVLRISFHLQSLKSVEFYCDKLSEKTIDLFHCYKQSRSIEKSSKQCTEPSLGSYSSSDLTSDGSKSETRNVSNNTKSEKSKNRTFQSTRKLEENDEIESRIVKIKKLTAPKELGDIECVFKGENLSSHLALGTNRGFVLFFNLTREYFCQFKVSSEEVLAKHKNKTRRDSYSDCKVKALAISPDNSKVLICYNVKIVALYDIVKRKILKIIPANSLPVVTSVSWFSNSSNFATGHKNGSVYFWETDGKSQPVHSVYNRNPRNLSLPIERIFVKNQSGPGEKLMILAKRSKMVINNDNGVKNMENRLNDSRCLVFIGTCIKDIQEVRLEAIFPGIPKTCSNLQDIHLFSFPTEKNINNFFEKKSFSIGKRDSRLVYLEELSVALLFENFFFVTFFSKTKMTNKTSVYYLGFGKKISPTIIRSIGLRTNPTLKRKIEIASKSTETALDESNPLYGLCFVKSEYIKPKQFFITFSEKSNCFFFWVENISYGCLSLVLSKRLPPDFDGNQVSHFEFSQSDCVLFVVFEDSTIGCFDINSNPEKLVKISENTLHLHKVISVTFCSQKKLLMSLDEKGIHCITNYSHGGVLLYGTKENFEEKKTATCLYLEPRDSFLRSSQQVTSMRVCGYESERESSVSYVIEVIDDKGSIFYVSKEYEDFVRFDMELGISLEDKNIPNLNQVPIGISQDPEIAMIEDKAVRVNEFIQQIADIKAARTYLSFFLNINLLEIGENPIFKLPASTNKINLAEITQTMDSSIRSKEKMRLHKTDRFLYVGLDNGSIAAYSLRFFRKEKEYNLGLEDKLIFMRITDKFGHCIGKRTKETANAKSNENNVLYMVVCSVTEVCIAEYCNYEIKVIVKRKLLTPIKCAEIITKSTEESYLILIDQDGVVFVFSLLGLKLVSREKYDEFKNLLRITTINNQLYTEDEFGTVKIARIFYKENIKKQRLKLSATKIKPEINVKRSESKLSKETKGNLKSVIKTLEEPIIRSEYENVGRRSSVSSSVEVMSNVFSDNLKIADQNREKLESLENKTGKMTQKSRSMKNKASKIRKLMEKSK